VQEIRKSTSDAKFLTFLIADVRGYTQFTRERGDAAAAVLAQRFANLAREAVEARGGRVIELRGDEALAVFVSPAQAVRAAVEFESTCKEESEGDPAFSLPVGIGIDAGEAVPVEDGYRGVALNMAARLCSNATAGQVLVTRTILERAELASDEVDFLERGPASFKGFERPVDVIEAVAPPRTIAVTTVDAVEDTLPPELDPLTPLVNRQHELWWLRGTWRSVRRRRGRVLFVSGPSQIGKTRLAAELAAQVASSGARVMYAGPGGAATAIALGAIRQAVGSSAPTLLIVDDVDFAGPEVAKALGDAFDALEARPIMVLCLLREVRTSELAMVVDRANLRGDGHRALEPFGLDGVREVLLLYAGEDVKDAPLESMARASEGVPGRIHEVASDWARSEASRRLEAAAEFLAAGRDKRAADLRFANNVIALKLGRLYSVEGRQDQAAEREGACPYKGLASFEPEDSAWFFGRERLVGELAARTVQVGLLGVVGASGSGKSSVVAAGLLPSLRAGLLPGSERWRQVTMRPGEHPLTTLRLAFAEDLTNPKAGEDPLEALFSGDDKDGRVVLIVDQFEETFTVCESQEERARFLSLLAHAAQNLSDRMVVLPIVRSDFYGHAAPYPEFAELLSANHLLVPPMSRDELQRAIELPGRRSGVRLEQELIDALVEEVADEPGGLPLLSTALVELWQAREGRWIRMDAYARTGGVRAAVARLAESSFAQLTEAEREATRRVFLRLVAVAEGDAESLTRRRVRLEEFDLHRDAPARVAIDRLARDRLLTLGEGTAEVAHEALIREWPRLQSWLNEDIQGRQLRHQLTLAAAQWSEGGREPSELYRGARLSATLDWSAAHPQDLNELEREFLADSRQASEREAERQRRSNRRLRALLIGAVALFVVALVAGGVALVQRGSARRAAERAERSATVALSQSLGAQAVSEPRLDTALLLGRVATTLDDSLRTRSSLLTALLRAPTALRALQGTQFRVNGMALSQDGSRLAVADNSGHIVAVDTRTGDRIGVVYSDFNDVALGPDGSVLRPVYEEGAPKKVEAVDPETGDVTRTFSIPPVVGRNQGASEAPRQNYAYDAVHDRLAVILGVDQESAPPAFLVQWRYSSARLVGRPIPLPGFTVSTVGYALGGRRLVAVGARTLLLEASTGHRLRSFKWGTYPAAVSPGGESVAGALEDGSIEFLDIATGKVMRSERGHDGPIDGIAFSPDGDTVISGGDDGKALLWDVATRTVRETLSGHAGRVQSVQISPTGSTVYTGSFDTTVLAWDLTGRRSFVRSVQAVDTDPSFGAWSLAVSPDSKTMAVGDTSGGVALWDVATLRKIQKFHAGPGLVAALSFTPDGHGIMVAGENLETRRGWVRIFRLSDQPTLMTKMEGALDFLTWATLSPDGKTVAATGYIGDQDSEYGAVAIWDAATGRLRASPLKVRGGVPIHAAFSPAGDLLALGGNGGVVATVDPREGVLSRRWNSGAETTHAVAFSPSGDEVATADFNGFIKFWGVDERQSGPPHQTRSPIHASEIDVDSVAWSTDGKMIATSGDGTLRLFDLSSQRQLGSSLPLLKGPPSGQSPYLVFTPDDRNVIASDFNGRAWVVPVTLDQWQSKACSVANRDLSRTEWQRFVTGRRYERVCG
jgi:WD40 repeat protein/class 3 adenylate cyclase